MGYSYSAPQWLLVFFLYCVLGWCFESTVVSVKQRHFVNRGFLRGPMLPIYGFGAVLLLHVSLPPPGTPPMSARIFRTVWTSFSAALTSALRVSAARAGACCAATRPPVRHSTTQFSRS